MHNGPDLARFWGSRLFDAAKRVPNFFLLDSADPVGCSQVCFISGTALDGLPIRTTTRGRSGRARARRLRPRHQARQAQRLHPGRPDTVDAAFWHLLHGYLPARPLTPGSVRPLAASRRALRAAPALAGAAAPARAISASAPALNGSAESFLNGTSSVYVEEMYHAWKKAPSRCVRP